MGQYVGVRLDEKCFSHGLGVCWVLIGCVTILVVVTHAEEVGSDMLLEWCAKGEWITVSGNKQHVELFWAA